MEALETFASRDSHSTRFTQQPPTTRNNERPVFVFVLAHSIVVAVVRPGSKETHKDSLNVKEMQRERDLLLLRANKEMQKGIEKRTTVVKA